MVEQLTTNPYRILTPSTGCTTRIITSALSLVGAPYDAAGRRLSKVGNVWQGGVNCFTFFLYVAQRAGCLPQDVDIEGLTKLYPTQSVAELWQSFLAANLRQVESMEAGDVLYLYPCHSAVCVAEGRIVHASDRWKRVVLVPLAGSRLRRVRSIWRLSEPNGLE